MPMLDEEAFEHPPLPRWLKIIVAFIIGIVVVMIMVPLITFLGSFIGLTNGIANLGSGLLDFAKKNMPILIIALSVMGGFSAIMALARFSVELSKQRLADAEVKAAMKEVVAESAKTGEDVSRLLKTGSAVYEAKYNEVLESLPDDPERTEKANKAANKFIDDLQKMAKEAK